MKDTALVILKFALAVLLLPLLIGSTIALQGEISRFSSFSQHCLLVGLVAYLILKFFVYDFMPVYTFGQELVTSCFQWLKPLVNVASYVIPIYTVFVLLAYALAAALGRLDTVKELLFILISATFSMHIILTAQDLYNKDSAVGKPNYFFSMQLVYIFDVFFIALVMNLILPGFAFIKFFQVLSGESFGIYNAVFMQLFGMR